MGRVGIEGSEFDFEDDGLSGKHEDASKHLGWKTGDQDESIRTGIRVGDGLLVGSTALLDESNTKRLLSTMAYIMPELRHDRQQWHVLGMLAAHHGMK